jgi:molybdopterin converting factor subunit 1
MVHLLYFAWVREMVGTDSETITLPAELTTVAALLDWLATRSPGHAEAFAQPRPIRAAVNQEFAQPDSPVAANDEIAFFPPVTGG